LTNVVDSFTLSSFDDDDDDEESLESESDALRFFVFLFVFVPLVCFSNLQVNDSTIVSPRNPNIDNIASSVGNGGAAIDLPRDAAALSLSLSLSFSLSFCSFLLTDFLRLRRRRELVELAPSSFMLFRLPLVRFFFFFFFAFKVEFEFEFDALASSTVAKDNAVAITINSSSLTSTLTD
jgi:hypothetical protein